MVHRSTPQITEESVSRDARSLPRSGFAWALLSGVLWGADGVLLGVALGMTPFPAAPGLSGPLVVAALHDLFGTGWILAFDGITGRLRRLPRSLLTRHGLVLCAAAIIGGPVAMSAYLLGIKYAGAAYTLAIAAGYPAVGAVLSRIFLHEAVTRRGWAGVAVTALGAAIVSYAPSSGEMPRFYLGIALAAIATVGWGIDGVLGIHSMRAIEPIVAGTLRLATSAVVYLVVVLPLAGALGLFTAAFSHPSSLVVLVTAAAGAGSYLTFYLANHLIGASRAMPLNSLYAVWGIVLSIVLTGLHPTVQLVAGVFVAFVGALLVISSAPRAAGDLGEVGTTLPPIAH
jgi:drug/metabolite transporter (DMT)-like permease